MLIDMEAIRAIARARLQVAERSAGAANAAIPANEGKGLADLAALAGYAADSRIADRHYRLTHDQADRAHSAAWSEVEIARFLRRRDRLRRLKFSPADAEDLAERLHLRDIDADDRVACVECRHYRRGCCYRDETAQIHSDLLPVVFTATLQRCRGFSEAD